MTRQEIEAEGFEFQTRGDAVFVVARRWTEEWGPFDSEAEACEAMPRAVPALEAVTEFTVTADQMQIIRAVFINFVEDDQDAEAVAETAGCDPESVRDFMRKIGA